MVDRLGTQNSPDRNSSNNSTPSLHDAAGDEQLLVHGALLPGAELEDVEDGDAHAHNHLRDLHHGDELCVCVVVSGGGGEGGLMISWCGRPDRDDFDHRWDYMGNEIAGQGSAAHLGLEPLGLPADGHQVVVAIPAAVVVVGGWLVSQIVSFRTHAIVLFFCCCCP